MAEITTVTWKVARTIKGLALKDAAILIGVTPQTLSKWEKGEGEPSIGQARKLSSIYGISLDLIE